MAQTPPLALTIGEPAGIGPELAAMAWLARRKAGIEPFVLIGDRALVAERARTAGLGDVALADIDQTDLPGAGGLFADALPVLPVGGIDVVSVDPGKPDPVAAGLVTGAIETAVRLVHEGAAGAVVTNPIQKETLYVAGFAHPGHTEFLGELAGRFWGVDVHPVMMLACDTLRVVPVTVHIPLSEVPQHLTGELIERTIRVVARDLKSRFGVTAPRIAVAGLNPHAGEGGTLGREETDVIVPALARLRAEGLDVAGPLPADTMFHAAARARYDAAVCMYHDQALVPIKTLAFDEGVNVTLGLPFIRTSPDHGTALDIAGTGTADPTSLIAALRLAGKLARTGSGASADAA